MVQTCALFFVVILLLSLLLSSCLPSKMVLFSSCSPGHLVSLVFLFLCLRARCPFTGSPQPRGQKKQKNTLPNGIWPIPQNGFEMEAVTKPRVFKKAPKRAIDIHLGFLSTGFQPWNKSYVVPEVRPTPSKTRYWPSGLHHPASYLRPFDPGVTAICPHPICAWSGQGYLGTTHNRPPRPRNPPPPVYAKWMQMLDASTHERAQ